MATATSETDLSGSEFWTRSPAVLFRSVPHRRRKFCTILRYLHAILRLLMILKVLKSLALVHGGHDETLHFRNRLRLEQAPLERHGSLGTNKSNLEFAQPSLDTSKMPALFGRVSRGSCLRWNEPFTVRANQIARFDTQPTR
jgi:hypothetical protein